MEKEFCQKKGIVRHLWSANLIGLVHFVIWIFDSINSMKFLSVTEIVYSFWYLILNTRWETRDIKIFVLKNRITINSTANFRLLADYQIECFRFSWNSASFMVLILRCIIGKCLYLFWEFCNTWFRSWGDYW